MEEWCQVDPGAEMDLLYSERCKTRSEAMSCEWYIKRDRKFRATLREAIRTRSESPLLEGLCCKTLFCGACKFFQGHCYARPKTT